MLNSLIYRDKYEYVCEVPSEQKKTQLKIMSFPETVHPNFPFFPCIRPVIICYSLGLFSVSTLLKELAKFGKENKRYGL